MSINEISARLDAATSGTWCTGVSEDGPDVYVRHAQGGVTILFEGDWATAADAELVAHAPTDLRDLLALAKAAIELRKNLSFVGTRQRDGSWRQSALLDDTSEANEAAERFYHAVMRLDACVCGAPLKDGECHSDHHMDFAVKDDEKS